MKGLLISYFYPPSGGGATKRVESFTKYAKENGFSLDVLTVKEEYYPSVYSGGGEQLNLSEDFEIFKTKSLDPGGGFRDAVFTLKEQRGIKKILLDMGRKIYRNFIIPDQFITWLPYGIREGNKITKKKKYDFILSTAPPFTCHIIGWRISKRAKIPLILDYRDLWNGSEFFKRPPPLSLLNKSLERKILKHSQLIITTTEEGKIKILELFPETKNKIEVITNGYDFQPVEQVIPVPPLTFLHAGSLTPERSPSAFLYAVKRLIKKGKVKKEDLKIIFMGYIHRKCYQEIKNSEIEEIIEIKKDRSYKDAVEEMKRAHILLILQSTENGGDTAIPGKFYDYLAMRKPILILDENGATSNLARSLNLESVCNIKDAKGIENQIEKLISNYNDITRHFNFPDKILKGFHRKTIAKRLFKIIRERVRQNLLSE